MSHERHHMNITQLFTWSKFKVSNNRHCYSYMVSSSINLHKWVFQKAEIARAISASAISAYWKILKCKLISKPYDYLLIQTWNNSRGGSARKSFLKPFFRFRENFFQSFSTKLLSLFYMISLAWKISHCLCANHNPELRGVIFTGVTLSKLRFVVRKEY